MTGEQYDESLNVEMHYQEILGVLNRIAENREVNMVSFAIVFIVALFIGYMAVDFGIAGGFTLRVPRDLFVMIVVLFVLIIALHKNDVCNLKSNKKNLNLSLMYFVKILKMIFQYLILLK